MNAHPGPLAHRPGPLHGLLAKTGPDLSKTPTIEDR
jgi:hypothetical protein